MKPVVEHLDVRLARCSSKLLLVNSKQILLAGNYDGVERGVNRFIALTGTNVIRLLFFCHCNIQVEMLGKGGGMRWRA
jgi:hypothetical protein